MNIDLYLDKNLTYKEIKDIIEDSSLNFIKKITIKNEYLHVDGNDFSLIIESKCCRSEYSEDEEFIHSELIKNFKIKPLTTMYMYCSNDGTGLDNFCAFIGYLQKFIHANYIAILEDVMCEDFAQQGYNVMIRDDYTDNSLFVLYKRLLNGNVEGYLNKEKNPYN